MSDASGVKVSISDVSDLYSSGEGDDFWVSAQEHDRIVAELKAEVERLKEVRKRQIRMLMNAIGLRDETTARQAKVIEKLKRYTQHRVDCICRAGVLQYSNDCDCGLKAIEKQGEGM